MKTPLRQLIGSLVIAHACAVGAAEPVDGQQIVRAGTIPAVVGPEATFTGRVRVEQLWPANPQITASGAYVTFEPVRALRGIPIRQGSGWWWCRASG